MCLRFKKLNVKACQMRHFHCLSDCHFIVFPSLPDNNQFFYSGFKCASNFLKNIISFNPQMNIWAYIMIITMMLYFHR